jgi:hypothetical protein
VRRVCVPVKERRKKRNVSGRAVKNEWGDSVYKPRRWHEENSRAGGAGASQWRLLVGDGKDTGRRKGCTDLPRPFKLDDLVSIFVDVNLFLCVVSPVLDDDEQEGTDEPWQRVPLHGRVAPCGGETFRRDEHTGSGKVWEVVERDGAGTTTAGYEEGCVGHASI